MASCAEAAALTCLIAAAMAALAGHWKLGIAAPVWDAASRLNSAAPTEATFPLPQTCVDATHSRKASSKASRARAMGILSEKAKYWHGQSQAALAHEALGRIRSQSGDLSGALQDIKQAARATSDAPSKQAPLSSTMLDSIRARIRVKEAELLLLTGDSLSAIDAVGDTISAPLDGFARPARLRVEGMKVLISAAIKMSPSSEELAGLQEVFEKTKDGIRDHADYATQSIIHEVAALIAEAGQDWSEALEQLEAAISSTQMASRAGNTLKQSHDRTEGDEAQAAELAALHTRMSEAFLRRAEGSDSSKSQWHSQRAAQLLKLQSSSTQGNDNSVERQEACGAARVKEDVTSSPNR